MFSLNSMRSRFHNTNMGKVVIGVGGLAMLVLAISGIGANLLNQRENPQQKQAGAATDPNVATVNGIGVSRVSYEASLSQQRQQAQMMGQPVTPFAMPKMRMDAFKAALNDVEMVLVAKKAGITVTDSDTSAERAKLVDQFKTQLGLPASASEDDVNTALQKYSGKTIDQEIDPAALNNQILIDKYQAMIKSKYTPTPDQVLNTFRRVHTRHILISNKTHPDAQAKALAQSIIDKIKSGADFGKLVQQYSDDTGSKKSGGDDGFIDSTTQYVPEFLAAALQLKDGQTTPEPVLSPSYGYFVIQAISSTQKIPADYKKNQAMYADQVGQQMQNTAVQNALNQESAVDKVTITDPLLKAYNDVSFGQPTPTQTNDALASMKQALPSASYNDKAEIYAVMGLLYANIHDTTNEIASLKNAVQTQPDPTVCLALGQVYLQNKDQADAIAQFQSASEHSYNDPSVHETLQSLYKKMGKTDLAEGETKWLAKFNASQKPASLGAPVAANLNP